MLRFAATKVPFEEESARDARPQGPMKIALLLPGGVDRSGTHRVFPWLLAMIERFVAAGDEVHVFALHHEPTPGLWPLLGATVHNAGQRPRSLRTLRSMVSEHRRRRFDVIHAFWTRPGVVGAAASLLVDVPLVMTLADGEVANHPEASFGDQASLRYRLGLRAAVARSSLVTAPSAFMTELAKALGIAAQTLTLGVDLNRWPVRPPRPRANSARLRLLHVGGLKAVKDQTTLLNALAILASEGLDFELEVIGEGSLLATIQQAAADLGLAPKVRFPGIMPQSELRHHFERADLLVVSSVHESGSLVTLEAAVAGVPTVGTRVGHVSDMAPAAAIAVPVKASARLADAIRDLAEDEARRLSLAAAAQAYAVQRDADYTAVAFREIYRALARAGKT